MVEPSFVPTYLFEAVDTSGVKVRGHTDSYDELAVIRWLQARGYSVLQVQEQRLSRSERLKSQAISFLGWDQVGPRDLALFTRQLSMMLSAGIHIIRIIDCLAQQTWTSRLMGPMLLDVSEQVREGRSLSQAFEEHPGVFSPLYLSLIVAGEKSGKLVTILVSLSDYLEADYKFRNRLYAALAYPAMIFTTTVGLLGFLMVYVFPKFVGFFNGLGLQLPQATQILYQVTTVLLHPVTIVATLVILPPLLVQLVKFLRTEPGKRWRDRLVYQFPILASLHRHSTAARFCRSASVLLESGLGQMSTLELMGNVVDSPMMKAEISLTAERIRDYGSTLGDEMGEITIFPKYCGPLAKIGEEAGKLPVILGRLATQLEDEVDLLVIQALNLLEPLLLAFMGLAVGFVLWSVFVPIYKMVDSL